MNEKLLETLVKAILFTQMHVYRLSREVERLHPGEDVFQRVRRELHEFGHTKLDQVAEGVLAHLQSGGEWTEFFQGESPSSPQE